MKPTKTYERAPVYSDLEVNETRVGIDWLTITANTADRKKMILLRFLKHEAALQLMGETRKNWKWRGYEGCAIGGITWASAPATNSDGSMIRELSKVCPLTFTVSGDTRLNSKTNAPSACLNSLSLRRAKRNSRPTFAPRSTPGLTNATCHPSSKSTARR